MSTIVDLINISHSIPLNGDILERVWIEKDASFKHLKVLYYRAFGHMPKDERSKVDVKLK